MLSQSPGLPATEAIAEGQRALDRYCTPELVAAFAHDQAQAAEVVLAARDRLAQAVELALPRMQAGGRLVYVGAGTSGRLGVLDGVELKPTFSWPEARVVSLLAGGQGASGKRSKAPRTMWHKARPISRRPG